MTAPFNDSGDADRSKPPPTYLPPESYLPPPDYSSSAGFPPPSYPPPPPGYPPPLGQYPAGYAAPGAAYGYHPITGEPLSDKSKLVAGLLQLIGLIGILGIGRMYMGQTAFGVVQLVGCIIVGFVTCGFGFVIPVVWGIIDAIVLMTGSPRDQYGRLLRDGS